MASALAVRTRSGLTETTHEGTFAAVGGDGEVIARFGDVERPFYLRSSAKPFQALVAQESGADLKPVQMALACASHDGDPAHIAIVADMLHGVGLDETSLRCPPSLPLGEAAAHRAIRAGSELRRIWHNCSGKHAAWLRSCVANGWPTDSYLDPGHPIQVRIRELVTELGGHDVDPVGVDGCGAPVLRTTTLAMARLFSTLAMDERFEEVYSAMHRYPALVSGVGNGDAVIATAIGAAAKRGAAGCLGVAMKGQMGIAVKSWDGDGEVAAATAVGGMGQVCQLAEHQKQVLSPISRPEVLGGGEVVGHLELTLLVERPQPE